MTAGRPGILHGQRSYLLQDEDGQVIEPHSISAGLDYPGIGPELSWLKDIGRIEVEAITDDEALAAFSLCSRLEGILPALEPSHAIGPGASSWRRRSAGPDHRHESLRARRQGRVHDRQGHGGRAVSGRIDARFARAARRGPGRAGHLPHRRRSRPRDLGRRCSAGLPAAGADLIEIGMPFTDPDGRRARRSRRPACGRWRPGRAWPRRSSWCAASAPATPTTPIVLMGYYNPIYSYGNERFLRRRQGRRGRRADRGRPAARGGRRAVPAGARGRASTSSAWRRPPPTTGACRRCSRTSRASSTTSRSPASPARRRPWPTGSAPEVARIKRHTAPAGRGGLRHPRAGAGGRDRPHRRCRRGRLGAGRPAWPRHLDADGRAAPGAGRRRCTPRCGRWPTAVAGAPRA